MLGSKIALRKTVAGLLLATMMSFTAAPEAQAGGANTAKVYSVTIYYRHCVHSPWQVYGNYRAVQYANGYVDWGSAGTAYQYLQNNGYGVFYRAQFIGRM